MVQAADTVELKPETLLAYATYIGQAEAAIEQMLRSDQPFLRSDTSPERTAHLRKGSTIAEFYSGKRPIEAPDGLIHDWIGATCVPDSTIERTLALVQGYDQHKNIYQPEVIGSKLIRRHGNDFQIYLRLRKKKIITVILDTDHDVHYFPLDGTRWCCHTRSTRICEVEDAGKPRERVRPPDTGYGFLWRLNSYWRFAERDNSVFIECRAISLTRNVPKGLAWIIEPMVDKLPGESLKATLEATRRALASSCGAAPAPA
jgi:hypothetical protein